MNAGFSNLFFHDRTNAERAVYPLLFHKISL